MESEFQIGDTINAININADNEKIRNTKGFLAGYSEWGDGYKSETFLIVDKFGVTDIKSRGPAYLSMKVCTCRMVLLEKTINFDSNTFRKNYSS